MKTKAQKQEELKKAEGLVEKSKFLAFTELSGIPTEEIRKFRSAAKEAGASILTIKKRLLGLALKNKGVDYDMGQHKSSIATIFSEDAEKAYGVVYKFLSNLGESKDEKAANVKKILGGLDLYKKEGIPAANVIAIGKLPPREMLIAQLMGMMVAPLRSFMYILQEKALRQGSGQDKQGGVEAKPAGEAKEEVASDSPAAEPRENAETSNKSDEPKQETSTGQPEAEEAKEGESAS